MLDLSLPTTARVFSYVVTTGGTDHKNDRIVSLSYRKSASKLPTSGCVTGCLEVTLVTDICPDDNAEVTVTCSNGVKLPKFYIASRSIPGAGLLTLVCYDRMMFADGDFDVSAYGEEEEDKKKTKTVLISKVVSDIISACGFSGGGSITVHSATTIPIDEIKGKSCREILELLSEGACGIWYCDVDNALTFLPFGTTNTLISPDIYSAVKVGSAKGPISRVIAENSTDGEEFDTLGGTGIGSIIRVESIFASAENASGILSLCKDFVFTAFKCSRALISSDTEIGCGVAFGDATYICTNFMMHFTVKGIYAELSAPELSESEYDYLNRLRRESRSSVKPGRTYKNVKISKYEGFSFVGRDSK